MKPGGGLGAETPKPGGGGGTGDAGAGAEVFMGKEDLNPGGGFLVVSAGNSSSCSIGVTVFEFGFTAASLLTAGGFSGWPLANPPIRAAVVAPGGGLFHVFSGTFSFCAAVSTEIELEVCIVPDAVDTDVEGAAEFFCCFFFLLAFEAGGSVLGVGLVVDVTVDDLLFPPLTVSREEISNMVGTERNSCCVNPPTSSSEDEGDRLDAAFPFSPTFFFLREDEVVEEESG